MRSPSSETRNKFPDAPRTAWETKRADRLVGRWRSGKQAQLLLRSALRPSQAFPPLRWLCPSSQKSQCAAWSFSRLLRKEVQVCFCANTRRHHPDIPARRLRRIQEREPAIVWPSSLYACPLSPERGCANTIET